jgi:hypothetical protein
MTAMRDVYADIRAERDRQDAQWGGPDHDEHHTPGEWRAFRRKFEDRADKPLGVPVDMRRDALVKIAALAVAQIEAMDRA